MRVVRPDDFDVSVEAAARAAPAWVLSADELVSAFEQDGTAAERRFAELPLVVSGVVARVHRGPAGGLVVNLLDSVFGVVACWFDQEDSPEVTNCSGGLGSQSRGLLRAGGGLRCL